MMRKILTCAVAAIVCLSGFEAYAHYHAIAPEAYAKWNARKGETVYYRLIWGHGFEHIWFDIAKPASFELIAPSGKKTDLASGLKDIKVKAVSGEEFNAYSFKVKLLERGDHTLVLKAGLQWDEEDAVWLKDYAKAVLHVQAQDGWDKAAGLPLEIVPMSRPYGLVPGDLVRVRVLKNGKPAAGITVERELLSEKTPAEADLPSEPFIAYPAVCDDRGMISFTFTEPGWYGLTAIAEPGGSFEDGGHKGPVVERSTLWIYVSPRPE